MLGYTSISKPHNFKTDISSMPMQMPNYIPLPVCTKTIFLAFTLHLGTQKTVPINFYIIFKIQPFQSLTFQACLCKCLTIPLPGCAKTIFLAFTLHLLWVHRKLYRSIFTKIQPFQSLWRIVCVHVCVCARCVCACVRAHACVCVCVQDLSGIILQNRAQICAVETSF